MLRLCLFGACCAIWLVPYWSGAGEPSPSAGVVAIVLDRSKSMEGTDPTRLSVEGAEVLLALLPAGSTVGLVRFSTDSEIVLKPQQITSHQDRLAAQQVVNKYLEAPYHGFTSYDGAMAAVRELLGDLGAGTVVFLTDGDQMEPPDEAWTSAKPRPPPWRESVEAMAKAGTRFVALDINPWPLDKRKPENIQSLDWMAQVGAGHVFRLRPPGQSQVDAAKLLDAFLFIAGETGNLFRTESRVELGVFPDAESLLVLAQGAHFSQVTRDGRALDLDRDQGVYRYQSKRHRLDVIHFSRPEPGNWRFETGSGGRIAFIMADPQLAADFRIEPDEPRYVGGLPATARLVVTPRKPTGTISARMAQCMTGVVRLVVDEAASGALEGPAEVKLSQVSATADRVVLEGEVVLPPVPRGKQEQIVTLDGATQLTFGSNTPWELVRRRQLVTVPPTGVLELALAERSVKTAQAQAALGGTARIQLPGGCEVVFRLKPDQGTPEGVTMRLQSDKLPDGRIRLADSEPRSVAFQCVVKCPEDFFGEVGGTIEAECVQGGVGPEVVPLAVHFVEARVKGAPGETLKVERGKPLAGKVGELQIVEGDVPLDVRLEWRPAGEWPAEASFAEPVVKLDPASPTSPIEIKTKPWSALTPGGMWEGVVRAHYGRSQTVEVPVRVQLGPLLSCDKPAPIVNEPGGTEEIRLELSQTSGGQVDVEIKIGAFLGDGKAKGRMLSLRDRVRVCVGEGDQYVSADLVNRPAPGEESPRRWTIDPGTPLPVKLQFDLRPRLDSDIEDIVVAGKYQGKITFVPLGAPEEESVEVPIKLVLGE